MSPYLCLILNRAKSSQSKKMEKKLIGYADLNSCVTTYENGVEKKTPKTELFVPVYEVYINGHRTQIFGE